MKNILLIEDNIDIRDNIEEILTLVGYTVQIVASREISTDFLAQQAPDLVLCDILMPEVDGYGVLDEFNKWPEGKKIPFIFMTALSENKDRDIALTLGVSHYLIKPFDERELLDCIRIHLKTL